ncbi:GIMA7 GTPase, partial [Amia calva]|nr:GIMA7 GTPase [Amia calva]
MCGDSVTKDCQKKSKQINRRQVTVVDTPGLLDTKLLENTIKREIIKCIALSAPGPHAFLLVIKVDRYTEEEKQAVREILQLFGEEALRHTMVLFTRGDQLEGKPIEQFVQENGHLWELVQKCGGGCHVFNNKDKSHRTQVTELLKKIDKMVKDNGGGCYTSEMYQKVQEGIRQEVESILRNKKEKSVTEEVLAEATETFSQKVLKTSAGLAVGVFIGALLGGPIGFAAVTALSGSSAAVGLGATAGALLGGIVGASAGAAADGPEEAIAAASQEMTAVATETMRASGNIVLEGLNIVNYKMTEVEKVKENNMLNRYRNYM